MTKACLSEMSKYSCPANNVDKMRMPDFVQPAGVMCRPCSSTTAIKDLSPTKDEFWVGLQWGPLIDTKGTMQENNVLAYSVHIVDAKGRILKTVDTVDKAKSPATCCTDGLYAATVTGKLPVGYSRFMITPVVGWNKDETVAYNLPMGFLTDLIVDVEQGLSTKVAGSFDVELSVSVEDLKKDKKAFRKVKEVMREAIADATPGVSKEWILIKDITQKANTTAGGRRLREETNVARRLANGKVVVDYEIIIPEGESVVVTKKSINVAKLTTAIKTRVAAKGITVGGKAIEVTGTITVNEPKTETVGTPAGTTGGARRHASLAACVGWVVLATVGMLH